MYKANPSDYFDDCKVPRVLYWASPITTLPARYDVMLIMQPKLYLTGSRRSSLECA